MKFAGTVEGGAPALVALGAEAEAVCRASLSLGSFAPALDQDLSELNLGHPAHEGPGFIYFGHGNSLAAERFPEQALICLAADLDLDTARSLGPGSAWFVGARQYSKPERDYARGQQRLMPLGEVELVTAMQTAAAEVGERPVFLSINLNVLSSACAPGVAGCWPLGAGERELWRALKGFRPRRLEGIEVIGLVSERDVQGRTAVVAAQLVRDLTLLHFRANRRSEG